MRLKTGVKKALSLLLSAAMVATGITITTNTTKAAEGDAIGNRSGEKYTEMNQYDKSVSDGICKVSKDTIPVADVPEKGSMSEFCMWVGGFADGSWGNQTASGVGDNAIVIKENGTYEISVTPDSDAEGVTIFFLDTNLFNGSTTRDFKLTLDKLTNGDREYTVDNTKGSYFLFGDCNIERCMRLNIVNAYNFLVDPDDLQTFLEGEGQVNAFGETIELKEGQKITATVTVSGMEPEGELYTYREAGDTDATAEPKQSSKPLNTKEPPKVMVTSAPLKSQQPANTPMPTSYAPELSAKFVYKKSGFKSKPAVRLSWQQKDTVTGYKIQRKVEGGKYSIIKTIRDNDIVSYTDTAVKKGVRYYYCICTYIADADGNIKLGSQSAGAGVTVSAKLITPKVTAKKKGNRLTITFLKAEGSGYQTQYRYLNERSWHSMGNLTGTLKKKITRPLKASGFRIRMRTYVRVNGKKRYSAWSRTVVVK